PRFWTWWALALGITLVTVGAYVLYFQHIGALDDLIKQDAKRSRGSDIALDRVLYARKYWIDLSFTPLAIAIGKIAAPIFAYRFLILRRPREIFSLGILAMAIVEYVHFKNGADVHTFWPLPFAPYWALSLGVLGETLSDLVRFAFRAGGDVIDRHVVSMVVLGVLGLVALAILPDGVRGLRYARTTGGRFNDRGRRIFQDVDKSEAASWMAKRMADGTVVQIDQSMHSTWAIDWALHKPTVGVDRIPSRDVVASDRYYIADFAFMTPAQQIWLAAQFHLTIVGGQFVFVDRLEPFAPIDAYAFSSREPSPLEWYFVDGVDPVRTVVADPFLTWEFREQFGQAPNPPPVGIAPRGLDDLRISHNIATVTGDRAGAERDQATLVAQLSTGAATKFTDGTQLLGERYIPGVAPVLEVYFLASGPSPDDREQFEIQSVIDSPPLFSLVERDVRVKTLGMPLAIPPRLWKPWFIYVSRTEIRRRVGEESYEGFFTSSKGEVAPQPLDGNGTIPLLTLR
ncbi:MAG: hypothetical protein ACREJ3_14990, partial [Polyangiaceae bacterium]